MKMAVLAEDDPFVLWYCEKVRLWLEGKLEDEVLVPIFERVFGFSILTGDGQQELADR